jgi:excisionase family DNA binding protein
MDSALAPTDAASSQHPEVLNIQEVAEYLRIPRSSIYKLAKRRGIPSQKVGRHWRFSRQAIDAWLASLDRADSGVPVQSSNSHPRGGA